MSWQDVIEKYPGIAYLEDQTLRIARQCPGSYDGWYQWIKPVLVSQIRRPHDDRAYDVATQHLLAIYHSVP